MKRLVIIVYWLIICVPTVVVGALAWVLVQHEQERLAMASRAAAAAQADALAQHLQVAAHEAQASVMRELQTRVDGSGSPRDGLRELEDTDPLVRHVFIWSKDRGVELPNPSAPATPEDRRFLQRYEALFTGTVPWLVRVGDQTEMVANAPSPVPNSGGGRHLWGTVFSTSEPADSIANANSPAVASDSTAPAQSVYATNSARQSTRRGDYGRVDVTAHGQARQDWLPWYADNRLGMLGWYQPSPDGPVYGVELEMMAFLSRLLPTLPGEPENVAGSRYSLDVESYQPDLSTVTLVLFDGSGQVLMQTDPLPTVRPPELARRPVGADLPHWQVVTYHLHPESASGAFALLGRLLVGILGASILAGGSLLLWQARRYQAEAVQKSSFVSNVSHELKTPLTSIRMYAELLHEGRVKDADKAGRYLAIIVAESQRLTRLVGNVLDFSRLEQGKQIFHGQYLDLHEVLQQLLDSQAMRLQAAGMAVTVAPDEDGAATPVTAWADRDATEQILLNLLDNAIKYGAAGGSLRIALAYVGDTPPGPRASAVLSLADRGPGVPPAQVERIFEAFHRVDTDLTATVGGTGLGLSIARRMARGMLGDVTYCPTTPGPGATFRLALPTAPPDGSRRRTSRAARTDHPSQS